MSWPMVREMVADFAKTEIAPIAHDIDERIRHTVQWHIGLLGGCERLEPQQ